MPYTVPDDWEVVTVELSDPPNKPPTSLCPVMFPDDDASDTTPYRTLPAIPPIVVPSAVIEPVNRMLLKVRFAVVALDDTE